MELAVGLGSDTHRLADGDGIKLGGVLVPCPYSCVAVSDGDVLLHALVDALLGAAGKGDIGEHYNRDNVSQGEDSGRFVRETVALLASEGVRAVNVDCTVDLEKPELAAWKKTIRENLSYLLDLPPQRINIKAKTGEGIGDIGESRAVRAQAVVLVGRTREEPLPPK